MQLHSEHHYGLKTLDTHASPELANKAALLADATSSWANWKEKMGKAKDEEIHATEAFTYADAASTRWDHLWNHHSKVPVRVLIMGSSLKFAHSTNGDKFKVLMLEKFGFEESEGNLIVEFFEDNFEDMGAINDLMRILKIIKAQVADRESCTFICFTGRFYTRNTKFIPTPEDGFAFWQSWITWFSDNDDEGCIKKLKPIILVPAASEAIISRCQALLRDQTPLGSTIVIFNVSWHQQLAEWLDAWIWEGTMFAQRTNKQLSFLIWNFC